MKPWGTAGLGARETRMYRSVNRIKLVRWKGFEPSRYCYRQPLKLVRLPVPPPPQNSFTGPLLKSDQPSEDSAALFPTDSPATFGKSNQNSSAVFWAKPTPIFEHELRLRTWRIRRGTSRRRSIRRGRSSAIRRRSRCGRSRRSRYRHRWRRLLSWLGRIIDH